MNRLSLGLSVSTLIKLLNSNFDSLDADLQSIFDKLGKIYNYVGESIRIDNSVACPLDDLKVYGRIEQTGTPTPDSPAEPSVSGSSGAINLTIGTGGSEKQTLPMNVGSGLCGIKVNDGGNYTDSTSQQYLSDVKDFQTGKQTQNIVYMEFTGSESWRSDVTSKGVRRYITAVSNVLPPSVNTEAGVIISNMLPPVPSLTLWNDGKEGISIAKGTKDIIVVMDKFKSESSTAAFKAFLASNHLKVWAQIGTPVVTDISEGEIESFNSLHTYDGLTVVNTDSSPSAGIKISYSSDGMSKPTTVKLHFTSDDAWEADENIESGYQFIKLDMPEGKTTPLTVYRENGSRYEQVVCVTMVEGNRVIVGFPEKFTGYVVMC